MKVFWEQAGILLPIYRLAGLGFNDDKIAEKLNLPQLRVQSCIAWLLHFLEFTTRNELVQYASAAPVVLGPAGKAKIAVNAFFE